MIDATRFEERMMAMDLSGFEKTRGCPTSLKAQKQILHAAMLSLEDGEDGGESGMSPTLLGGEALWGVEPHIIQWSNAYWARMRALAQEGVTAYCAGFTGTRPHAPHLGFAASSRIAEEAAVFGRITMADIQRANQQMAAPARRDSKGPKRVAKRAKK